MIKNSLYILSVCFLFASCAEAVEEKPQRKTAPITSNDGNSIVFPEVENMAFFKTEEVSASNVEAELTAPGKVAATVLPSGEGASGNLVLFNNPELAANYTQLIQHQINIRQIQQVNIRQKELELERIKDLQAHGSATGQELLNAETDLSIEKNTLANERAALIEHETQLRAGGFNPKVLRNARVGTAYIICDIPENQITKITTGQSCRVKFSAFPNEEFSGRVDGVADIVDNVTRMVKARISLKNPSSKLKSGMFANISFGLSEGDFINIDKSSLVTVKGKDYVFVKTGENEFERREIQTGQQIGDRIVVFGGLEKGDHIAVEGVMQLKGLSFGY